MSRTDELYEKYSTTKRFSNKSKDKDEKKTQYKSRADELYDKYSRRNRNKVVYVFNHDEEGKNNSTVKPNTSVQTQQLTEQEKNDRKPAVNSNAPIQSQQNATTQTQTPSIEKYLYGYTPTVTVQNKINGMPGYNKEAKKFDNESYKSIAKNTFDNMLAQSAISEKDYVYLTQYFGMPQDKVEIPQTQSVPSYNASQKKGKPNKITSFAEQAPSIVQAEKEFMADGGADNTLLKRQVRNFIDATPAVANPSYNSAIETLDAEYDSKVKEISSTITAPRERSFALREAELEHEIKKLNLIETTLIPEEDTEINISAVPHDIGFGNARRDQRNTFETNADIKLKEDTARKANPYYDDIQKAGQYADKLREELETLRSQRDEEVAAVEEGQEIYEAIEDNTALELAFGVVSGLDQFGTGIGNLFTDKDYYAPTAIQIASASVREDLADDGFNLPEFMGGGSIAQAGYDMITTTSNMLPSILASAAVTYISKGSATPAAAKMIGSAVGSTILGTSAGGNAYAEMINLGYDKEQARTYATLVGGSETGLQYLMGGIGKLGGKITNKTIGAVVKNIDNAFARTAIKFGGKMASEGLEEYAQEILDPFFRNLAFKENNEINLFTPEALYSGVLGAFSAGFLDGVPGVASAGVNAARTYQTGKKLSNNKNFDVSNLVELGNKMSADSVAYKIANKVNEKTGAYTIGKLFHAIGAELSVQNQQDIVKSLTRKGVAPENAETIADWLGATVNGAKLTKQQINALELNEDIADTFRDVVINPNSTINQRRQAWFEAGGFDVASNTATDINAYSPDAVIDRINESQMLTTQSAPSLETQLTQLAQSTVTGKDVAPATETRSDTFIPLAKQTAPVQGTSKIKALDGTTAQELDVSSVEGKTILKSTNEDVNIKKITSIDGNNMTLELEDGRIVSSKDVSYGTQGEALVYETVADLTNDIATANAIVGAFNASQPSSPRAWLAGAAAVYTDGMYNIPFAEISAQDFTDNLSEREKQFLYNLGQKHSKAKANVEENRLKMQKSAAKRTVRKKGKVTLNGKENFSTKGFTNVQRASVSYARMLSEITGVEIRLFESEKVNGRFVYTDENGEVKVAPNGKYIPGSNIIMLDINAGIKGEGTMLYTLSHELTHFIKEWSPAKFTLLADFLMEQYGKRGQSVDELVQAQIRKAKSNGRTIDYDTAYEEVIADSMEGMLTDGKVVEKLQQLYKQDKTLFEKISDFISKWVDKVRQIYSRYFPNSKEGKLVLEMKNALEELQSKFAEAIYAASENVTETKNTATNSGVEKYSAKANYDYSKPFEQQIDDYKNGLIPKSDTLVLGGTPEVYQNIGFNSLPMTINTTHVDYALNGTRDADHFLGESLLKQLPEKIKEPVAVFISRTKGTTSVVALLNFTVNGKQTVAPIVIDGFGFQNSIRIDSNSITSVYGKTSAINQLWNAVNAEANGNFSLLYANKKETATLLQRAGHQLSGRLIPHDGFYHSIRENNSPVKPKFENVTESRQFKNWFGDWQNHPKNASKVVNADGTPKVMYHGTPAQFTVFDKKKAKSSGFYGRGFYFTDSESHSNQYGNSMAVYLDVKNPLTPGENSISKQQLRNFLEAVAANEDDYDIWNYGTENLDEIANKIYKNDAFAVIQDVNATTIGDFAEALRLFNEVNGTDFDGIITPTETVVFEPTQIKSATDNIGTFDGNNPDIRYSDRDYSFDPELVADLQADADKLKSDVANLKELLKLQQTVTHSTVFTKTSVNAAASKLMKTFGMNQGKTELASALNEFYRFVASAEDLSWEAIMTEAGKVADRVIEIVPAREQRNDYAEKILKELRTVQVSLTEEQKAEISSKYGSYNNFRKSHMGSMILSDSGISLEKQWQEWTELYPDVFDKDVTAADMPETLSDIVSDLRLTRKMVKELDTAENRQMMLNEIYDSYWGVSTLHTLADRHQKQVNLLKSKHNAQMSELRTEYKEREKKTAERYREMIKRIREHKNTQMAEYKEAVRVSKERMSDKKKRTEMRNKIKKVVNELNQYLLNGTKDKHVMDGMQKAVAEALSIVNMDTVGADERVAKYNALIAEATDPDVLEALTATRDRIKGQGDRLAEKLTSLQTAYSSIINSSDPLIANAYDEVVEAKIASVTEAVGNTPLRDMSMSQLEEVYDLYKMVLTNIRKANKLFATEKQETIEELGFKVDGEVKEVTKQKDRMLAINNFARKMGYKELKPIYFFRMLGSDTMSSLYKSVRDGQNIWYKDASEAKAFRLETEKNHNYKKWDFKKKHTFEAKSGKSFDLTLSQIMSIYAFSRREQAFDHLIKGGFVFDDAVKIQEKKKGIPVSYTVNTSDAFNLSEFTLGEIIATLTDDQKAFVETMQTYLSDTMGAKGNEVSLELYGVKMFKEKNYFPLKSSQYYMAFTAEEAGETKIKNSSFSKETVKHANNPIVLSDFMDVWTKHVNDMAMYHAFVLPLEDFTRVYNYRTPTTDGSETTSIKSTIHNHFTESANDYIKQLLKDINGGSVSGVGTQIIDKMVGLAKKGAVFASLSVVVQQPSAIVRAMAYVNPKYFINTSSLNFRRHNQLWEECKQYAPIAGIKEMGYFDTSVGRTGIDWLKSDEYDSIREMLFTFFKDKEQRRDLLDDALSKAPAMADELSWVALWEAIKKETKNTTDLKVGSEEFFKHCGERFTEVVDLTQVYDSVFSRSELMRSKDRMVKVATAFMAEPTTQVNMLFDAALQFKRKGKAAFGTVASVTASVVASMVVNSLLKSVVLAGRDDDEDETYLEKYVASFTGDVLNGMNPLTLIPFVKDVISIIQGYSVDRMDMSVVDALITSVMDFGKDTKTDYEKWTGFIGAVAQLFGVPVKNILRDINAVVNTFNTVINGNTTTRTGLTSAIKEGLSGTVTGTLADKLFDKGIDTSKGKQYYDAVMSGDTEHAKRIVSSYGDTKKADDAIVKALKDFEPRVTEAAQAQINGDNATRIRLSKEIIADGFKQDYVVKAVNSAINTLDKGEEEAYSLKSQSLYSKDDYFDAAYNGNTSNANTYKEEIIRAYTENNDKTKEEAESSFNNSFRSMVKEAVQSGEITVDKATRMLADFGGLDEKKAHESAQYYDFIGNNPELEYNWQSGTVADYLETAEPNGISVDVYDEYLVQKSKCTGVDKDGDGKADIGTKKAQILKVINSLTLTSKQKDTLYLMNNWSKSTLYEAPWH